MVHSGGLVWPDGEGPSLIVDDGGDATLFVHKAAEFEKSGKVPAFNPDKDPEEWGVILRSLSQRAVEESGRWTRRPGHSRRERGDDDGRAPAVSDEEEGDTAVPRHQRQQLGDQEQVRQHLRMPSLAAGRPGARDRRHARRQGRVRRRLRRSRQGLRAGAPRPGLPCRRHRNRSDCALQAAMEGYEVNTLENVVDRWTSSSRRPATSTSSPPSTWRR